MIQRPSRLAVALFLFSSLWAFGIEALNAQTSDQAAVNEPDPNNPATAPLATPMPVDPAVREAKLDNGLTYILRQHGTPAGRLELRLIINVGSLQEDDDQQGLAHFVEHMAFNGTKRFARQELVEYLESVGMRFGADINASTSWDETQYMLTIPTDKPQVVETAFDVLRDWATAITFDAEEIDKERGVVIEEWRLGRGAGARLADRQYPLLFSGSRYAERMPIGKKEILETAPRDAFLRYYKDWYRPDLMAIIAVGDLDLDATEAMIKKKFGSLKGPETPRERVLYPLPEHNQPLVSVLTDPEATETLVEVYSKLPRRPEGTYGDYRSWLLQSLYDGMMNSRLSLVASEPDSPFLNAASGTTSMVRTAEADQQIARVEDGAALWGLDALLTEIERVRRHGFRASELDRVKKDMLRSYELAERDRKAWPSANLAAEYTRHFLDGEPIPGLHVEAALIRRFVPDVTLDEINRLAKDPAKATSRVILVSGPEREGAELPSEEQLLAVFKAVGDKEIEPWIDEVVDRPLMAEIPEPGQIVSEETLPELNITRWKLSNGATVLLKPTDFHADQILLTGFSPGGHSLVKDEDHPSALYASLLLNETGRGDLSRIELDKLLAGRLAMVEPYIGELEEGVNAVAAPEDFETMMQLLHLTFTEPVTEDDLDRTVSHRLGAVVENRYASPEAVFGDRMNVAITQGHVRRRPVNRELVEEIKVPIAYRVYDERFADAGDFTFILVGAFQIDTVRPMIETYVASLPSLEREESWRDVGVRTPEGVVEVKVEKGLAPKALVQVVFTGDGEWSREALHEIHTLAAVMRIRLREILREDLGGTYGVQVQASLESRPRESYRFVIAFGCAPENVERLTETLFAEFANLRDKPLDGRYLDTVKEAQRRERELAVSSNGFWLEALKTYTSSELDPHEILSYDDLVTSVTAEDLQSAAKRYLNNDRYVLGTLLPEATTAAAEVQDEETPSQTKTETEPVAGTPSETGR